ncbi:MAG: hypothetical protein IPL79_16440 [Myxococcales bacterium]|nr:hypothetical protein [Myxococcales bacterium]
MIESDDDSEQPDHEWSYDAPTSPGHEPSSSPTPRQVASALRSGLRPAERAFDQFLPAELRVVSGQHWTPLAVALRVAQWLDAYEITSVVDIGAGAGKFCVAAALASKAHFIGVEQRRHFVAAANTLAGQFNLGDRCRFVVGTLGAGELPAAEAYYLYNPFGENLFGPDAHIDDAVELSNARFERDVAHARKFFAHAPAGTYVIEYNGFGGELPDGYQELLIDWKLPNVLRLSRKVA